MKKTRRVGKKERGKRDQTADYAYTTNENTTPCSPLDFSTPALSLPVDAAVGAHFLQRVVETGHVCGGGGLEARAAAKPSHLERMDRTHNQKKKKIKRSEQKMGTGKTNSWMDEIKKRRRKQKSLTPATTTRLIEEQRHENRFPSHLFLLCV